MQQDHNQAMIQVLVLGVKLVKMSRSPADTRWRTGELLYSDIINPV